MVRAVGRRNDLPIGKSDTKYLEGNHVVIKFDKDKFALLAHLQQKSVTVKVGDRVQVGQLIGRCGNSGNTSEPHLHIQLMSQSEVSNQSTVTYPIVFKNFVLRRWGKSQFIEKGVLRRRDEIDNEI
ncbi:MAG: M23 family metallopeptidase [Elusimicrobia bacterium]|nr:M23 family metallopeptidase [Elusimicrobiota bacterium]